MSKSLTFSRSSIEAIAPPVTMILLFSCSRRSTSSIEESQSSTLVRSTLRMVLAFIGLLPKHGLLDLDPERRRHEFADQIAEENRPKPSRYCPRAVRR